MLIKDGKKVDVPTNFSAAFKKPVMFELHSSQTPVYDGKKHFPKSRGIESYYQMLEKEQLVIFRYADTQRSKTIGGIAEIQYSPGEIEFLSKGNIVCDPSVLAHRELYYWMHNHPQNASGPNFDAKKGPIFYQVNPEKEAKDRVEAAKKKHDAEELILNTWKLTQLREIALGFGDIQAMEKNEDQLQDYLLSVMAKDPVLFYNKATSDRMKRRAEITEAQSYGIISFNEKDRVWSWGKEEVQNGAQICTCMPSEEEKERILRYFDNAIKEDNSDYLNERLSEERKEKPKLIEAK